MKYFRLSTNHRALYLIITKSSQVVPSCLSLSVVPKMCPLRLPPVCSGPAESVDTQVPSLLPHLSWIWGNRCSLYTEFSPNIFYIFYFMLPLELALWSLLSPLVQLSSLAPLMTPSVTKWGDGSPGYNPRQLYSPGTKVSFSWLSHICEHWTPGMGFRELPARRMTFPVSHMWETLHGLISIASVMKRLKCQVCCSVSVKKGQMQLHPLSLSRWPPPTWQQDHFPVLVNTISITIIIIMTPLIQK